ncbi:conserved hypothetical protein [Pseudomonas sp. IT-P291]
MQTVLENGRKGQKGINVAKTFDRNSPLFSVWDTHPVGAGLPAKAVFQPIEMRRMCWPLRWQPSSYKGLCCGRN